MLPLFYARPTFYYIKLAMLYNKKSQKIILTYYILYHIDR